MKNHLFINLKNYLFKYAILYIILFLKQVDFLLQFTKNRILLNNIFYL